MTSMEGHARLIELYTEQWRPIFGYACRRVASVEDATDAVSEVFLVAWRRIGEVPEGSSARLWLFGVARKVLSDQARGRRRQDRLGTRMLEMISAGTAHDPADLLVHSEDEQRVKAALADLSENDRELLSLTVWEELSPAQAAKVLNITAVAARARLSRARRRLAVALQPPTSAGHPTLRIVEGSTR